MFFQQVGAFIGYRILLRTQRPVFLAEAVNSMQQAGHLFFKTGEFQINL